MLVYSSPLPNFFQSVLSRGKETTKTMKDHITITLHHPNTKINFERGKKKLKISLPLYHSFWLPLDALHLPIMRLSELAFHYVKKGATTQANLQRHSAMPYVCVLWIQPWNRPDSPQEIKRILSNSYLILKDLRLITKNAY